MINIWIYLIVTAAIFAFNMISAGYLPLIFDMVWVVLTLFLVVSGIILIVRVKVEAPTDIIYAEKGKRVTVTFTVRNKCFLLPLTMGRVRFRFSYHASPAAEIKPLLSNIYYKRKKLKSRGNCDFTVRQEMVCDTRDTYLIELEIPCPHCEYIDVSVDKIYIFDYLRFFYFSKKKKGSVRIAVMPSRENTGEVADAIISSGIDEVKYSDVKPGDDPTEIFNFHEYVPGDKIRQIHWKLSTKIGKTMVKEYSLPIRDHAVVVADIFTDQMTIEGNDKMLAVLSSILSELSNREDGFDLALPGMGAFIKHTPTDLAHYDPLGDILRLYDLMPYRKDLLGSDLYAEKSDENSKVFYIANVENDKALETAALLGAVMIAYAEDEGNAQKAGGAPNAGSVQKAGKEE